MNLVINYMKKIIVFLLFSSLLQGCTFIKNNNSGSIYQDMIKDIANYEDYINESEYFKVNVSIKALGEDYYRYDVFINEPTIELRHVRAIAVLLEPTDINNTIFPSLGYNENEVYHLTNDSSNKNGPYYRGIQLSGISQNSEVAIKLYIEFSYQNQYYQQYILVEGKIDDETG